MTGLSVLKLFQLSNVIYEFRSIRATASTPYENDEVRAGCPKLGQTTLQSPCLRHRGNSLKARTHGAFYPHHSHGIIVK